MNTLLGFVHFYFKKHSITGLVLNIPLNNIPISYLQVLSYVLLYRYITCSPVSNDEIAGARPDIIIKVTAYVKA